METKGLNKVKMKNKKKKCVSITEDPLSPKAIF